MRAAAVGERCLRLLPYTLSCGLHGLVIVVIFGVPPQFGSAGQTERLLKAQIGVTPDLQPRTVIWIPRKNVLPQVSPGMKHTLILPYAEEPSGQTIVAARPELKQDQFIWVDEPKISPQSVVPSPNIITLAPQALAPPPPKRVARKFSSLPARSAAKAEAIDLDVAQLNVDAAKKPPEMAVPWFLAASKLKAPLKKFVAPPSPRSGSGTGLVELVVPDELSGVAGGSDAGVAAMARAQGTLAIISANPAVAGPPADPQGIRAGGVSIGGQPTGQGTGQAGGTGGAVVPGLAVRGGETVQTGANVAGASSNPAGSGAAASVVSSLPPARNTPAVALALWPNARRVPPQVESLFRDRPVFVTLIQSPNGTPDWVIWFADTVAVPPGTRIFMRPPVPRLTYWRLSLASIAGLPEFVWAAGRLRRDGKLAVTSTVPPLPAETGQALLDTLNRWLFTPAVRNGEAVDVEVLVGLAPAPKR